MTVVLVHGCPETADVWSPLGMADAIRLSPPGFGAPTPPGWSATIDAYRDWLIGELERFEAPVDLVGHDWGGVHVLGVAMRRPDLIRTWCVDSIGLLDADYQWHSIALTWQADGLGELTAPTVGRRAAYLRQIGLPDGLATALAPGCGDLSGDAVLRLYRDARQPAMARLGGDLPAAAQRPGLVLLPEHDRATGTEAMKRRAAALASAEVVVLPHVGHWWMLEDPHAAAQALQAFWATPASPSRSGSVPPAARG